MPGHTRVDIIVGRALGHGFSTWSTHIFGSSVVVSFTARSIGIWMIGFFARESRPAGWAIIGRVIGCRGFTWYGMRTIAGLHVAWVATGHVRGGVIWGWCEFI
jgi:hypothetical protein